MPELVIQPPTLLPVAINLPSQHAKLKLPALSPRPVNTVAPPSVLPPVTLPDASTAARPPASSSAASPSAPASRSQGSHGGSSQSAGGRGRGRKQGGWCCRGGRARAAAAQVERLQREISSTSEAELAQLHSSASRIQSSWRSCQRKVLLQEFMRHVYSQPDLSKARKHAQNFLPKDRHGNLYPLTTSLKTFHPLGCGLALYFHLLHWWWLYSFLLLLMTLPVTSINLQGSALPALDGDLLTRIQTSHTLGNADELTLAHGVTEILVVSVTVWFMFWQSSKMKRLSARITHQDLSASNYTVLVSRLPATLHDVSSVQEYFHRWGVVVHVGIVFDHRELILGARLRSELRQRLADARVAWYNAKSNSYPKGRLLRHTAACARAKRCLVETDRRLSQLASTGDFSCTGHAFITFDTVEAAQDCIAACREVDKYFEGSGPISVRMAPEPQDLIWENLQYSSAERCARSFFATALMLMVALFSLALIIFSAQIQDCHHGLLKEELRPRCNSGGPGAIPSDVFFFLLGIGLLVAGYCLIFLLVPLLAYKVERHHTCSARERAIYVKLVFFQTVVTVFALVYFLLGDIPALRRWVPGGNGAGDMEAHNLEGFYTSGAKVLVGGIVGDAVIINLLIDLWRPDIRIARWQARRARTQRRMNRLWKRDGDLYLAFRLQLASKWVVLGLGFYTLVPALVPLMCLQYGIANWVDRYNILRALTPPPPEDASCVRILVQWLLPFAVLLHMAVTIPAFAVKEERLGVASVCAVGSAAVFAPLTLYFMYRESRERRGYGTGCLRLGPRLAALREYYLDLPGGDQDRAVLCRVAPAVCETFRESHDVPLYLPPVGGALLLALGRDLQLSLSDRRGGPAGKGTSCSPDLSLAARRGRKVAPAPFVERGWEDDSDWKYATR